MPTITLQVGQCGNQLGNTLWGMLQRQQEQLCNGLLAREWFGEQQHARDIGSQQLVPRLISIDSESKVAKGWGDADGSAAHQLHILGHGGCGNNWACGYHFGVSSSQATTQSAGWSSSDGAASRVDQVLEGIRKEAEQAAGVVDFLLIASLAGGTGSGTGSALMESLADEYPASTLAAVAVAPGHTGDSTVQSINSCLAMQHLSSYAHAVILIDNQALLDQLNAQPSAATSNSSTSRSSGGSSTLAASSRTGKGLPSFAAGATAAGARGQGLSSRAGGSTSSARAAAAAGSGAAVLSGAGRACLDGVNRVAAEALLGLLWPLGEEDVLCGRSTIRQLAATVCADPLTKFVQVCSVSQPAAAWASSSTANPWPARLKLLSCQLSKDDPYNPAQPASTSAALVIARGMPGTPAAPAAHFGGSCWSSQSCWGGYGATDCDAGSASSSWQQELARSVCSSWPRFTGSLMDVHMGSSPVLVWGAGAGAAEHPSLTAAVRRSSIGSLMRAAADRSLQLCEAGAYMHWYEAYGCSRQDIMHAAHAVSELGEAYTT